MFGKKTSQIILVNDKKESQIDGKTIKHAFVFRHWDEHFYIGFEDGTWGHLKLSTQSMREDDSDLKKALINDLYGFGADRISSILGEFQAAGILDQEEISNLENALLARKRQDLKDRIKSLEEELGRLRDQWINRESEI